MRLNIIVLILTLTLAGGCATNAPRSSIKLSALPQIGSHFQPGFSSDRFQMTSSASVYPTYPVAYNGIDFVVAVSPDDVVQYLATFDPRFVTPEGIHVGSPLSSVLATGATAPMSELGWALHTQLPSGWSAAFTNGASMSETPLPSDARVVWIFQR